jgi:hypothetical protein
LASPSTSSTTGSSITTSRLAGPRRRLAHQLRRDN